MSQFIQNCRQCGANNPRYESHCTMCSAYLSVLDDEPTASPKMSGFRLEMRHLAAFSLLVALCASLYWVLQPAPPKQNISKYVGRGILYDHRPDQKLVYDAPINPHAYEQYQDNRHFYTMLDLLIQAEVSQQMVLTGGRREQTETGR